MNQSKIKGTNQGVVGEEWSTMLWHLGKGVAIAFFSLLILLFLSALAISNGSIVQEDMKGIVLVCTFLSCFLGALFTLSQNKKYGILLGSLVGVLLFFFLYLLGLALYTEVSLHNSGLEILFAAVCGGAIAKFLVKKKKNTKKAKKS